MLSDAKGNFINVTDSTVVNLACPQYSSLAVTGVCIYLFSRLTFPAGEHYGKICWKERSEGGGTGQNGNKCARKNVLNSGKARTVIFLYTSDFKIYGEIATYAHKSTCKSFCIFHPFLCLIRQLRKYRYKANHCCVSPHLKGHLAVTM